MKNFYRYLILALCLLGLLAAVACGGTLPPVTALPGSEGTRPVMRVLDLSQVTLSVVTPTVPTAVPTPTRRPTPSAAPTNTLSGDTSTATPACTNLLEFLRHLTIPPKVVLKPGEVFTKMWEIRNIGTCSWTTDYALVFVGGYLMDAPQVLPLPQAVEPGATIVLRLPMVAPLASAEYHSLWLLRDANGNLFGGPPAGDTPLEVVIQVPLLQSTPHL